MSSTINREFSKDTTQTEAAEFRNMFSMASVGKRLFDIVFSLLGLIILSPFFLLIAARIKKDSPGPVFYHGVRVGKFSKPFKMFKFRTMYEEPASYAGASITSNEDPRVTPYGTWLRNTKINELPQLWNVLLGHMSLVGPRPEVPEIIENWPDEIKREILSVRPGITSPSSIIYRNEEQLLSGSGFMDDYLLKIVPDKLRLDQLYVQNRSFLTDLDVISMTIVVLLPGLRKESIHENWFYHGVLNRFFHRVLNWFVVDTIVSFITVGLSGVIWRISAVINLGVWTYMLMALGIAIMISIINLIIGLPRVVWKDASATYVMDIGFSVGLSMVLLWVITRYWLTEPWIPFSLIWLIGTMTLIGLITVRYRERLLTGLANRWLILRGGAASVAERILIVGAGELGELAIWLLQRSAFSTVFGIVGVVDDEPRKQDLRILGFKVLGNTRDIPALVEKYDIGMIVYAISNISPKDEKRIMSLCDATSARTIIIPDLIKVLEKSFNEIKVVN